MIENKKGGRPTKSPGVRLEAFLQFRVRGELRSALEKEAAVARRTVSEECEYRLNRSVLTEASVVDVFGHKNHRDLVLALCSAIRRVEEIGDERGDKLQAYAAVLATVEALADKPAADVLKEAEEAGDEARNVARAVVAAERKTPLPPLTPLPQQNRG